MRAKFIILISIIALYGCAVGNQYSYHSASMSLPMSGSLAVAVNANDHRAYVMSGGKSPNFVGLQRGGFGNPFDVTTASGNPLARDFESAIVRGLQKNGYAAKTIELQSLDAQDIAAALSDDTDRLIVLNVGEWKTDVFMNITLSYDLSLLVYNRAGELLAQSNLKGQESIGGGSFESKNSSSAIASFEQKIGYLFNDADIKNAL